MDYIVYWLAKFSKLYVVRYMTYWRNLL